MIRAVLLVMGLLLTAAWTQPAAAAEVIDLAGRTVTVPARVERIILGEGRYLPTLAILDRTDPLKRVVGMMGEFALLDPTGYQQYLDRFPDLGKITQVGQASGDSFSVEKAIALAPDLAIFALEGHSPSPKAIEIVAQLEAAGIAVVFIDFRKDPLVNTPRSIELLGKLLGREAEAAEFTAYYDEQLKLVTDRLATVGARPRVFLESRVGLTEECCATMGNGMMGRFIEKAGGTNIATALVPGPSGTINLEYLLAQQPDIYIATAIGSAATCRQGPPARRPGGGRAARPCPRDAGAGHEQAGDRRSGRRQVRARPCDLASLLQFPVQCRRRPGFRQVVPPCPVRRPGPGRDPAHAVPALPAGGGRRHLLDRPQVSRALADTADDTEPGRRRWPGSTAGSSGAGLPSSASWSRRWLVSVLFDVATGPSPLSVPDIVTGLLDRSALPRGQAVILWDLRLPYAAMAVLVGAALGLAGAEMQTVLNNPLASPFTLGVSAAATLGASLVIVMDLSVPGIGATYLIPAGAFVFAVGSVMIIQMLARSFGATTDTVVLFGIAMLFAMNALLWLVQYVASTDALQQMVFWTMGSLGRSTWDKVAVVAVVLGVCLPLSMRKVWAMTALRGGEDQAKSFGIPVETLRLRVLLRVSVLAAAAVAFVGTIGFIGLVGPAHRPAGAGRGPPLLPAGQRACRSAAAVAGVHRQQEPDSGPDPAGRHRHGAGRHPPVHDADPDAGEEAVSAGLSLEGRFGRLWRAARAVGSRSSRRAARFGRGAARRQRRRQIDLAEGDGRAGRSCGTAYRADRPERTGPCRHGPGTAGPCGGLPAPGAAPGQFAGRL